MTLPSRSLSFLDVGHGNSAVLHTERGAAIIDAGPGSALLEFLRAEAIEEIDIVLISHSDKDHIEGLLALLGVVKINKVCLNTDSKKESHLWDDLLYALDCEPEITFQVGLTSTQTGEFDFDGITIQLLAPSSYFAGKGPGSTDRSNRVITTNSISAVVRLLVDGSPIAVLMGDIDHVGLENMTIPSEGISAPILVFPHHGGLLGTEQQTVDWAKRIIDLVTPDLVVFSIGRGQHGTPRHEVISAIKEQSEETRLLCTQLSENCSSTIPATDPIHMHDTYSHGRCDRKCCAGTVVIDLENPANIFPENMTHQNFISVSAPNALCA